MSNDTRPILSSFLNCDIFIQYYYLKDELMIFCKNEGLQATGSKIDLTERIYNYLKSGSKESIKKISKPKNIIASIELDSIIEDNFVCSEVHRAFYKKVIGNLFSFNVEFQKWLKNNSGKSYQDSIIAYCEILEYKKNNKTKIDKQFEYNTYIREFFLDNNDKTLNEAIMCWKYKKSLPGTNKYEKGDLKVLVK